MTESAIERTLTLLRTGWDMQVLRESFFGVKRFDEFQRNLGIGRGVLAERLRSLVAAGILERRVYQERPERSEYVLSQMGLELYPIFVAMLRWGDRWLEADERVVLTHERCGHETLPLLVCDHCNEPIDAREVRYEVVSASRADRHAARARRS